MDLFIVICDFPVNQSILVMDKIFKSSQQFSSALIFITPVGRLSFLRVEFLEGAEYLSSENQVHARCLKCNTQQLR